MVSGDIPREENRDMKRFVFGKSVQGASHKRAGTECQDSNRNFSFDDGTIILAVADGHGSKSCPYSKSGSNIAVNVFCHVMGNIRGNYIGEPEKLLTYLNREGETKIAQAIDSEWKRRVLKAHTDNKRGMPGIDNKVKQKAEIYKQYGTTLVGLMITPSFLFAFQLGDGDISYVDNNGFALVLQSDKILGTETHSLSRLDSWKRAITLVCRRDDSAPLPCLFMLSTDGLSNSYTNEQEFQKTCVDYFEMIKEHGAEAVDANLKKWLSETSEMGCGDDITLLMTYFYDPTGEIKKSIPVEEEITPTESEVDVSEQG